jgi:uncharacterized Zn finger protein (UPF0148 family)
MIKTTCKICGYDKEFRDIYVGKTFKCPNCKNSVKIEKVIPDETISKQSEQSLNSRQFPQVSSNFVEFYMNNRKTVYFGGGIIVGLLILIFSIKYLMSNAFSNPVNNVEKIQKSHQTYQEAILQNSNKGNYQYSSEKVLTINDIINLNKFELKIMRNEIYARHGYIFKTAEMRTYFESQSWYTPIYDDVTSFLTDTEKKNIELIKSYE